MSQLAPRSKANGTTNALASLGIVSTTMGFGALIGGHAAKTADEGPIATLGGAIAGAGLATAGGALVAATGRDARLRKAGRTTALIGVGSIGFLLLGTAVVRALRGHPSNPAPAPTLPAGAWTPISTATVLQPGIEYRFSDAMSAADLQSPPTLVSMQDYLGPIGIHVDGAWVQTPPSDWPAGDTSTPTAPRAYIEFSVTHAGAQLPGVTVAGKLYALQPAGGST